MVQKSFSLFDLAPGKHLLGRYKIEKPHRHGGMSATFLVEDEKSGEKRELQVFHSSLFEGPKQAGDFGKSMKAWTKIESTAVLSAHDIHALDDGTMLFVTEVPPGGSLREWSKARGPQSAKVVIDFGLQLLDGLEKIHAAGLVHGDIKPHTIHVEEKKKPRVLLVDGGITPALWSAKHLGDKTALIGTPFYAPVEQFGGESPDVQSDLYNLACVLYELASGVLPWKGKSFLEVFQEKLQKRPPSMKMRAPKSDVPPTLEAAIEGGLMADKRERYATAKDFKARLSAAG